MLVTTCPWCSLSQPYNASLVCWCAGCSHRLGVSRENCDCLLCIDLAAAIPEIPDPPQPEPFRFLTIENAISESSPTDYQGGGVQIVGRFFRHPLFSVSVFPSRVVLRISDDRNAEEWVDVTLSEEVIYRWAREMGLASDAEDSGDGIE